MDGNGTSVAGAQFVEPLAAVALDRLVVGDPLREQESLDAVDVFDPLGDQRRTLAAQASSILLLGRGRDGHGADARLTALEREQRAQQRLSVEPVGFGVAPTPRRGDRRRIDHVALDAFSLQQAMQPEAVEPRLLDSDDREGVSGASLSLALEFGKAQQQRRHVAGGHAVLRHFLARPRRQRCDEPDFAAQLQRDENRGNVGLDGGRNFGTVGCFRHFPLLSGSFDNPTLPERRGMVAPQGKRKLEQFLAVLMDEQAGAGLSRRMILLVADARAQWSELDRRIAAFDAEFVRWAKENEDARRLTTIPGFDAIVASALVASVGRAESFERARDLSAWLGIVPQQFSTGGKPKLLGISKRGNKYLRKQLIHGARAALPYVAERDTPLGRWAKALMSRAHRNVAVVAFANKLARIAWAVLRRGEPFDARAVSVAA